MRNYDLTIKQIESLVEGELDLLANLANVCAVLKTEFNDWWVGFYMVKNDELVLGPFQGPVACTRIAKGKGVCGTAFKEGNTIIVDDVHQFEGHIACSAQSNSEIVVPIKSEGKVVAVLDIDSVNFSQFTTNDKVALESICELLAAKWS